VQELSGESNLYQMEEEIFRTASEAEEKVKQKFNYFGLC
jgi:hypothetical protein